MIIKIDKIIRSKRKSVALEVTPDAKLIIRAPLFYFDWMINMIVNSKKNWILKKQNHIKTKYKKTLKKEFIENEEFLYLGNYYKLSFTDKAVQPLELNKNFILSKKLLSIAKAAFLNWYKTEALNKISERAEKYAYLLNLEYSKIKIGKAKKQWGSCTHSGNLIFSWRLIMAPLEVLDYVVVHEIIHLEEKNHAKQFWNKVEKIIPDYKKHRKWLKENGHSLNL